MAGNAKETAKQENASKVYFRKYIESAKVPSESELFSEVVKVYPDLAKNLVLRESWMSTFQKQPAAAAEPERGAARVALAVRVTLPCGNAGAVQTIPFHVRHVRLERHARLASAVVRTLYFIGIDHVRRQAPHPRGHQLVEDIRAVGLAIGVALDDRTSDRVVELFDQR